MFLETIIRLIYLKPKLFWVQPDLRHVTKPKLNLTKFKSSPIGSFKIFKWN